MFSDERCALVFKIILPGLILSAIYAVVRGYFWGNKSFFIYSIIELLEELIMVIVGIALVKSSRTLNDGISRAAIAVITSYVFSFTASLIMFKHLGGGLSSSRTTLKPFILSSLPITGMRTSTALVNSLIAIILPSLLTKYGLTTSQALSTFGAAFGMAIPVLFMPSTLIGSIAVVLVPELSENYYKNNSRTLNNNINSALKFAIYVSYTIIPILLIYGRNIGIMLFNSTEAGEFLSLTSPITLPMSVSIITTSILNSLNKEKSTFLYFLFGAISLLACIYILTPTLGIYSLSVGLAAQFCISAICNTLKLVRILKATHRYLRFALKGLFLIISSTIFTYFMKNIVDNYLPYGLSVVMGCCMSVAFISILLVATGSIDLKNRVIK